MGPSPAVDHLRLRTRYDIPMYNIALIGCGVIAGTWIKTVEAHARCAIRSTCDVDRTAAEKAAGQAGAEAAESFEQVLASPDIDIVILGTPTPTHPHLAIAAARAGKHILCEKPMALTLGLCQDMIHACRDAGVKMSVGHSLRFFPAFLVCRRLIDEGAIGVPVAGGIRRMGTAAIQRVDQVDGTRSDHWRSDVRQSGGAVFESFIHEIDVARLMFGEVASVSCQMAGGRNYDGILSPQLLMALVSFESGALVTMRTGSTVAIPTGGCWVSGTEGGLRWSKWGGPVEHHRDGSDVVHIEAPEEPSAYYLELSDLISAIESDSEPENHPLNGKKNIALGLAMCRSFETGQRIVFAKGFPEDVADDYQNLR